MQVPFVDLKAQSRELHDEFEAAIWSVIDRAAYTLGPELQAVRARLRRALRLRLTLSGSAPAPTRSSWRCSRRT